MAQIIVGFDGSPPAENALRWAAFEADLRGWPLRVLRSWRVPVVPVPEVATATRDLATQAHDVRAALEAEVSRLMSSYPKVSWECDLCDVSPARGLIDSAGPDDLIVVGARGAGGFAGLHLGSVSHRVARHSPVPLVVNRGSVESRGRPSIVVGIDASPGGRHALAWAADLAELHHKLLIAVHAWNLIEPEAANEGDGTWPTISPEQAADTVATIVTEVLGSDRAALVEQRCIADQPAKAVLDAGENASLIVVGRSSSSRWSMKGFGATNQQVLHHAAGPVAVVPSP